MRRALLTDWERVSYMAGKSSSTESSKTLFVRNLPYTIRDDELEAVFSEYGPLKSCFTIKEKGTVAQCRGFGYVIFAIREDAERAKRCVKLIGGRPVQVMFAKKRPPGAKGMKKGTSDGVKEGGEVANGYRSSSGDSSADEEEADDDDYEMRTAKGGSQAAQRQHKPKSQRGAPKYDIGRTVVLKNLPEMTTEKKISKKCKKFGTVESVTFPVPDRDTPTAFVTFESFKEARAAVSGLDGTSYKSMCLAVVLLSRENKSVSKKTLKKSRLIVRNLSFKCSEDDLKDAFSPFGDVVEIHIPRKSDGVMLGYAFVQFGSFFSAAKALAEMNTKDICGRPVAVDWVVPRDQYKQSLQEEQHPGKVDGEHEEEGDSGLKDEALSGDCDGSNSEEKREGEDVSMDPSEDSDSEEEESDESDVGEVEKKPPQKKIVQDVHEGKTLFVRNVPFDADDGELKDVFVKFGGVRYCRLVRNPTTKVCKGSAFVQFYELESVQRCLQSASSEHGQGIQYGGRRLDVVMAITKSDVDKLKEEKAGKEVVDRRNFYLAKEGVIPPDSEAAKDLSKSDLAKRMRAQSEKKTKLANPNFFVSKTRLSVRNIPTQVDEKQLKSLFLKAAGGPPAKITQAKLLRSSERVNSQGKGRSKGYAFVEFTTHEAALRALRGTNNNPEPFGTKKRLIVEFAVEDSRALKIHEQRKQRQLSLKKTTPTSELHGDSNRPPKKTTPTSATVTKKKVDVPRKRSNSASQKMSDRQKGVSTKQGTKRKLGSLDRKSATKRTKIHDNLNMSGSFLERKSLARTGGRERRVRTRKKKQTREVKEEQEFAGMIDKYKRKLFGSASSSRWFE